MDTSAPKNRSRPARPRGKEKACFPSSRIAAANVSSVPQRSLLRYPGGKTWLIPHIRAWLAPTGRAGPYPLLVEPFAGGGIVSLTAVMEGLVERAIMIERDPEVAAFWQAALRHGSELDDLIRRFKPTRRKIEHLLNQEPKTTVERGFRALVMNRTRRGGVMAPGANLIRYGDGKGVASRWYPKTLLRRLDDIRLWSKHFRFLKGDGVTRMEKLAVNHLNGYFFIDPPYTARGGKNAGSRLYAHNIVDHAKVFRIMAESHANFLMTYDRSEEVLSLIRKHNFSAVEVDMTKVGRKIPVELVITRERLFA